AGSCLRWASAVRCSNLRHNARWNGRPRIATAVRTATLRRSCRVDPHASLPLPNATDTPMSDAAGIVVTEMNTPMRVLDRASVSETTPTMPASAATMNENQFGVLIRLETGRTPAAYAVDSRSAHRTMSPSTRAPTTAKANPTPRAVALRTTREKSRRVIPNERLRMAPYSGPTTIAPTI